jgi:hypothetical protein
MRNPSARVGTPQYARWVSNNKRPKNREPHHLSTRRPPSAVTAGAAHDSKDLPPDPLMASLNAALGDPQPIALLHMASAIIAAGDPREYDLADDSDDGSIEDSAEESGERFIVAAACEAFMAAGLRQTDALLTVIATLTPDAGLRERIRASVAMRGHDIPAWTSTLDQTRPTRVVEMTHPLGDGENVAIGVALPGDREISFLIYVDHNLGTIVKDAFATDIPLDDLIDRWVELAEGPDATIGDVPLGDARARLTEAIATGALSGPSFETETWPLERPLLEWVLSLLPAGGAGYQRATWSSDELDALADRFFLSADGLPFDNRENYLLYDVIDEFGTGEGPGDPLHWSPTSVEILLLDWIPRTISAGAEFLANLPALLRAFVRFAHADRGIPSHLTDETLAAIDAFEPAYLQAIRVIELQDASGVLLQLGLGAPDADIDAEELLAELARNVGGRERLALLTATPLPDEQLDWAGIKPELQDVVTAVNTLIDDFCASHFDAEFRTACRRFLAKAAGVDPAPFRRGSSHTLAAAVCLVICRANDRIGADPELILVKNLLAWFGVSGSVNKRAEPLLRAVGADPEAGGLELGDGELLDSATRAGIIAMRDLYLVPPALPAPEA